MGGHVAGEVASRVAVEAIEAFIEETAGADKNRTWPFPFDPTLSLDANRLKAAFRLANRRIAVRDRRLAGPARHGHDRVGAAGRAATSASVGARRRQPRLRAARRHSSTQITHDHSWVEEQVRAGTLTPERRAPASVAQRRHPRAVGRRRSRSRRHRGDASARASAILLCSDGLFGVVTDERIAEILGRARACRWTTSAAS